MKKILFPLAACALALTACTSDEVVEQGANLNAIGFQNAVSKETRALGNDNFNTFNVYGYYVDPTKTANPVQVFDGEKVTKPQGSTSWGYTDTRYWVPGMDYYFYAYSCENSEFLNGASAGLNMEGQSIAARALSLTGFVCNESHQHDLVFASNDTGIKGLTTGNQNVPLDFKHILSRVNVVFESEFAAGYEIEISNVQIQNIYDKGNFTCSPTAAWNGASMTKTDNPDVDPTLVRLSVPTGANIAAKAATEGAEDKKVTTGNAFVLPHNYDQTVVRLVFTITITAENGEEVLSKTLRGSWKPNWQIGTAYTYTVNIAGTTAQLEPIVFETATGMDLDNWTDGNEAASKVEFTFSAI